MAGRLGFLSSCDGDFREPLMLPQGSTSPFKLGGGARDCSGVTAGESDLILYLTGNLWCFSSCGGKLGVPLKFRWGPQVASLLASDKSSFLSSYMGSAVLVSTPCREIGPHHTLMGKSHGFSRVATGLEVRWRPQGASCLASGKSSLISSCEGERGRALKSLQGNPTSSH